MKFVYDERKKKWTARLTIIRPRPAAPALHVAKKIAVHRGMRVLFTWATSDGDMSVLDDGQACLGFKRQMRRRRSLWQAHKRNSPSRARGRGWWRRYEQYRSLTDIEARWTDTHLKQYAAAIIKKAVEKGCGTIILDDWSSRELAASLDRDGKEFQALTVRQWPFAAQRSAIERAAETRGIVVETVESNWESATCPKCSNVDASQNNGRGLFTCANAKCGLQRDVEQIAAWNQLTASGSKGAMEKNEVKRAAVRSVVKRGLADRASTVAQLARLPNSA